MPFVVVYDASVFYPDALRDPHIRVAGTGLFQAKWTRQIVAEAMAALARNRPDIPAARLERLGDLINDSVPDCLITGYEPLIENLKLPDADDRHVLAAAIKAGAQVIVTANLRDFPTKRPGAVGYRSPGARRLHAQPDQRRPDDGVRVYSADRRFAQEAAKDRKRRAGTARAARPGPVGCHFAKQPARRHRPVTGNHG